MSLGNVFFINEYNVSSMKTAVSTTKLRSFLIETSDNDFDVVNVVFTKVDVVVVVVFVVVVVVDSIDLLFLILLGSNNNDSLTFKNS